MNDVIPTTSYEVENLISLDGNTIKDADVRIIAKEGNLLQLLYNNKKYVASIRDFDPMTKFARVNVDGYDFRIKIKEPIDQLINELGFLTASKHSIKEIKSPMPGLVVNVFVEIGQQVLEGEKLLSLEAMKMENILKSPGEGVVKSILVEKGQTVDKNQILITFA